MWIYKRQVHEVYIRHELKGVEAFCGSRWMKGFNSSIEEI